MRASSPCDRRPPGRSGQVTRYLVAPYWSSRDGAPHDRPLGLTAPGGCAGGEELAWERRTDRDGDLVLPVLLRRSAGNRRNMPPLRSRCPRVGSGLRGGARRRPPPPAARPAADGSPHPRPAASRCRRPGADLGGGRFQRPVLGCGGGPSAGSHRHRRWPRGRSPPCKQRAGGGQGSRPEGVGWLRRSKRASGDPGAQGSFVMPVGLVLRCGLSRIEVGPGMVDAREGEYPACGPPSSRHCARCDRPVRAERPSADDPSTIS
jgi:hypothetical protein